MLQRSRPLRSASPRAPTKGGYLKILLANCSRVARAIHSAGSYFFRMPVSVLVRLLTALFAAGMFTAADDGEPAPGLV
jgi:hypothetical protein